MSSKTIMTPVLKFWGFKQHPFDDRVLRGSELELFVDRKTEIRRLQNALSNPLSGVFGAQGAGKSSVLYKLEEWAISESYPVVVTQMSGASENLLYREILAAILQEIKAGKVKVLAKLKLKVDQEIERVQNSIKYTSAVEAAGEAGWKAMLNLTLKAGIKEQEERELAQHTEESALALIKKIAMHKKAPFVVIVDNLERARFLLDDEDAYFRFVTKFSQTIDGMFSDLGVPFVVSLDQIFADRINDNLPGTEEAASFSFGKLVELSVFPPPELYKLIARRLECRKWEGAVEDFVERNAFWALVGATGGHSRRAFAVLREAMELVAERSSDKTIGLEQMRTAIAQCGEKLDEKDLLILQFIEANGARSSSDEDFSKAVGLSRVQRGRRLNELVEKGLLRVEEQSSGKTKKYTYFLVKIDEDG
ncbi:hypothetical protein PDESU_06362 [Pontiella desulfatans]|uniref:Orc1-like AAA ATPase domain-containing protein n=1 Tax=Pontiella desulfatans TaxID=2750659 RepID=A0A6C2UCA8_PONDE|nr:AAA family ATPase [Pontiella desulfatans]VGO17760.1 hypothetical protein PDESU_06362 [Pontiella desulfatans]